MMVADLSARRCTPCEGGVTPLEHDDIERFLAGLRMKWEVHKDRLLRRSFEFDDFMNAMLFVNDIAAIAEDEGHHPDMKISYRTVTIELTTHAIHGLSDNDFILARKIELCC